MYIDPIALIAVILAVGLGLTATTIGARRKTRAGLVLGIVAVAVPVLALFSSLAVPALSVFGLLLILVSIIIGIVGVIVAATAKSEAQQTELAAARAATEHTARVEQIRQWEAAYADAHDGAAPPPGFAPPVAVATPAQGTNGFAIAGFIFGLLGGWLGIVFGFIALSQIKRTGQPGRGLAITGIAIAFFWIAVYLVLVVIGLTANR